MSIRTLQGSKQNRNSKIKKNPGKSTKYSKGNSVVFVRLHTFKLKVNIFYNSIQRRKKKKKMEGNQKSLKYKLSLWHVPSEWFRSQNHYNSARSHLSNLFTEHIFKSAKPLPRKSLNGLIIFAISGLPTFHRCLFPFGDIKKCS